MHQHTGLSQPGYGLLGLGVAYGGLRGAGPPWPQRCVGYAGSKAKAQALRIMSSSHWSERLVGPCSSNLLNRLLPHKVRHMKVQSLRVQSFPFCFSDADILVGSHPPSRDSSVYPSMPIGSSRNQTAACSTQSCPSFTPSRRPSRSHMPSGLIHLNCYPGVGTCKDATP